MFAPKETPLVTEDIQELYYVVSIHNLASILTHGVLSRKTANKRKLYNQHHDISNPDIQHRRDRLIVSPGTQTKKNLHDYVPLSLQPFSALLLSVQNTVNAEDLCILRISKNILSKRKDAILTNKNAACSSSRFFKPLKWSLSPISSKAIRSRCLKGDNRSMSDEEFRDHMQKRQAEALFFDIVPAHYIRGILVSKSSTQQTVNRIVYHAQRNDIPVQVHPSIFPKPQANAFTSSFEPLNMILDLDEENLDAQESSVKKMRTS